MEVRKSENPDFQIFENPDFRKSDFRKSGSPENPDFWIFRFSGFSENRKIQKSCKKASDVEFAYVEFPLKSTVIPLALDRHRSTFAEVPTLLKFHYSTSDASETGKSGFPEIGLPKIRKTRKSGFSDIPIFRIFGKSENPEIR